MEIAKEIGDKFPFSWPIYVKCYIEGDFVTDIWYGLMSPYGNSCDFRIIMENAPSFDA